ncbi:MAG TPA: hypothetical protein IAB45_05855 [Candidatus Onthousia faecavium]|nr:hypothetical protein [Candidatus Onthousia faecavium]
MSFKNLFTNQNLLTILHNVLENSYSKNKVSKVSLNGESYQYNQYSLLIIMDFIIKYKIIVKEDKYLNEDLVSLEQITNTYENHETLTLSLNNFLIKLTARKLNLENTNTIENKRTILIYIYDNYIVNGYCFHSFPSCFKNLVERDGLIQEIDTKELNTLKRINYIFTNHKYPNFLGRDLTSKTRAIYITDSPAMAYYYAIRSPEYLANLTGLSNYYKNISDINKESFYLKDYNECKNNLKKMCEHLKMTSKEETAILKTFSKEWKHLDLNNSKPCIAFIKRKELAKDSLPNIIELLANLETEDLVCQVSKIINSRYPEIRRFSNITSLDLTVYTMPSYKEIKNNHLETVAEEPREPRITIKIDTPENDVLKSKQFKPKFSYSYGNASLFALLGLLLISLGLTLSIILKIMGG